MSAVAPKGLRSLTPPAIIQGSNMCLMFPIQAAGKIHAVLIFGNTKTSITTPLPQIWKIASVCRVKKGLADQLEQIASKLVTEYWNDNRRDILGILADSFLEEYDDYKFTKLEQKLGACAAGFLGKQME